MTIFLKSIRSCPSSHILLNCSRWPLPAIATQRRDFKYKSRSFLSDKEGVNNFIDLLGCKERKLLLDELVFRDTINQPLTEAKENEVPTLKQMKLLFLHQLLPFVGFGFLDNLIMIVAGDYIDTTIGVTLGISTMAAAGLGNALSDVAGVGSAWYVEKVATRVGIEHPKLSPAQLDMGRTRWTMHTGRAFGVLVGCLLGMVPLLFMSGRPPERDEAKVEKMQKSN